VRDFREFVVQYDAPLIELVHRRGGYVWCHSHGQMGPVLELFADMGVDCLNPIEPPPMGDVTLAQAKARVGQRMCLEGNVEQGDFYVSTPDEMRQKVATAIREGAPGGGFILCPTSSPWQTTELSEQALASYLAFIDAGRELGGS
jgi:uroporphyrinogen-III decarboxylase